MASTGNKLLQIDTGILNLQNACVVIVKTEWNAEIVDALETGCKKILMEKGVKDIRVLNVPGAFEIPFAISSYWNLNKYKDNHPDAFIALGCVIRGDTPHFEYVCRAVTDGVLSLNLSLRVPTIFGVLTVDNLQQALDRIGGVHGHKGEEAALTALKMLGLMHSFGK